MLEQAFPLIAVQVLVVRVLVKMTLAVFKAVVAKAVGPLMEEAALVKEAALLVEEAILVNQVVTATPPLVEVAVPAKEAVKPFMRSFQKERKSALLSRI